MLKHSAAVESPNGHEQIDEEIESLRHWWSEIHELGTPHFGEMGDRLLKFRETLEAHFADEESSGVLSLVVKLPPDTVEAIAQLRDEHRRLLTEIDEIVNDLAGHTPAFKCWGDVGESIEALFATLRIHEEAERNLRTTERSRAASTI